MHQKTTSRGVLVLEHEITVNTNTVACEHYCSFDFPNPQSEVRHWQTLSSSTTWPVHKHGQPLFARPSCKYCKSILSVTGWTVCYIPHIRVLQPLRTYCACIPPARPSCRLRRSSHLYDSAPLSVSLSFRSPFTAQIIISSISFSSDSLSCHYISPDG